VTTSSESEGTPQPGPAPQPAGSAPPPQHPGPPPYPAPYPYPQPYWMPPGSGVPPRPTNTMATTSGVLGIVGFAMAVIPAVYFFFYKLSVIDAQTYTGVSGVNTLMGADFVVATLAVVFGAVSLARAGGAAVTGKGIARVGLVLGAVSLVLAMVFLPLAISAANNACGSIQGGC